MTLQLRHSARRLLRAPAFAVAVILLVAAVVAINATTFAALHALRWKALPYDEPQQLVDVRADMTAFGFQTGLSEPLYRRIRDEADAFAGVAGFADSSQIDASGQTWALGRVTHDFLSVLGTNTALGRSFSPDEAMAGAEEKLVLSDRAWRARFDGDPQVVGRTVEFAGRVFTVIGVMPPAFAFPDAEADAWMPYVASADERESEAGGMIGRFSVVARLRTDATIDQARAEVSTILENDPSVSDSRASTGLQARIRPWRDRFSADFSTSIALLQLAALLLTLVAALNLANLMLDRMMARQREFAICRALGARRRDLMIDVVTDLTLPVLAGAVIGLLAVPAGIGLLRSRGLLPAELPVSVGGDFGTFAAGVACVAVVIAVALVSALLMLRRQAHESPGLREKSPIGGLGRARMALLVAQIALTTALVGGGGLLLRSASNLISQDRGFDSAGVVLTSVDLTGVTERPTSDSPADRDRIQATIDQVRQSVAALPGVSHVAAGQTVPFGQMEIVAPVRLPGHGEPIEVRGIAVSDQYFEALGIPLMRGRAFTADDAGDAGPVIVDEAFRARWLDNIDPLTATIQIPDERGEEGDFRAARVIGVVPTVKHAALDETIDRVTVYQMASGLGHFFLVTRTERDPAFLIESIRERITGIAPDARIGTNRPLDESISRTLVSRRALIEAISLFAILTLLLAALGLYAVLSVSVRRRTAEVGVRMALGAKASRILGLVMGQGIGLIAVGVAVGIALGIPLSRLLAGQLYQLAPSDPATWAITGIVIVSSALLACWMPARRAARVSPNVAIRAE